MLKAASFSEKDLSMARFITNRISAIAKDVLSDYGIKFPEIPDEGIAALTTQELLRRNLPERSSLFVPLSVADQEETIIFWLITAFSELIGILTDEENVTRPGLRCEYLIVRIIEEYIKNIYETYAPEEPEQEAFCCDIPSELNALIDEYRKEAQKEFEEDLSSSDIDRGIRNGLADIRCWIDHPDAPDFYGLELLLEDDYWMLLDKYDEGSLYYTEGFSGLGVFQWRNL